MNEVIKTRDDLAAIIANHVFKELQHRNLNKLTAEGGEAWNNTDHITICWSIKTGNTPSGKPLKVPVLLYKIVFFADHAYYEYASGCGSTNFQYCDPKFPDNLIASI